MGRLQILRQALACPLALVLLAGATGDALAAAADKAFTVGNYPVEAEAKDAVAAKDKALADGQQAAFRSLLKRLVPVTAYNRLDRVKGAQAADIIDGVRVRSEQNSSTRYIASLDFSFQPEAVRDILTREGVPFVEEQAPRIVLVPVLAEAGAAPGGGGTAPGTFRAATGPWQEAWQGLDLDNTLSPAGLATLKPEIHPDSLRMALKGDGSADRILAGEYGSEYVVVAIAEVDQPGKRLNVTLAGRDAVGDLSWKRAYRIGDGGIDYAAELAAVVSLGVLEGRWKAVRSGAAPGSGSAVDSGDEVALDVQFASITEWNDLRSRILNLPGVDDVRVGAVSARNAQVSLKYPGGGRFLADALSRQGLALDNVAGVWEVRSGL